MKHLGLVTSCGVEPIDERFTASFSDLDPAHDLGAFIFTYETWFVKTTDLRLPRVSRISIGLGLAVVCRYLPHSLFSQTFTPNEGIGIWVSFVVCKMVGKLCFKQTVRIFIHLVIP